MKAPLQPQETKVWSDIYVWADPSYTDPMMSFAIQRSEFTPPPGDWFVELELTAVPKGLPGVPAVGTTWPIPPVGSELNLPLPTFNGPDPLESYAFKLTVAAVPEPSGALLGLLGVACLRRLRAFSGS
jgi:hypothetical protein